MFQQDALYIIIRDPKVWLQSHLIDDFDLAVNSHGTSCSHPQKCTTGMQGILQARLVGLSHGDRTAKLLKLDYTAHLFLAGEAKKNGLCPN